MSIMTERDRMIEELRRQLQEAEREREIAEKEESRRIRKELKVGGEHFTELTLSLYELLEMKDQPARQRQAKGGEQVEVSTDRDHRRRTARVHLIVERLIANIDDEVLEWIKRRDDMERELPQMPEDPVLSYDEDEDESEPVEEDVSSDEEDEMVSTSSLSSASLYS